MTDGGQGVTNGGRRHADAAWLAAVGLFAAIALAFAIVNAVSTIDDHAALGRPVEPWRAWTWELTSFAAALLLAPLVFWMTDRLRPPRLSWPAAAIAWLLLSAPFSAAHVGLMYAFRKAVYAAAGHVYSGAGSIGEVLVYEYRKDLITYAALLLLLPTVRRLMSRPIAEQARAADQRLEVRDGSRTVWLAPVDVEWAQAAGNYVELHGAFGSLLHRRTLAALEQELEPHGFRRVHRSRIVRADAVRAIETRPSGDFDVTLASGTRVGGSRRFRERLG